jgi:hypothetical protein
MDPSINIVTVPPYFGAPASGLGAACEPEAAIVEPMRATLIAAPKRFVIRERMTFPCDFIQIPP